MICVAVQPQLHNPDFRDADEKSMNIKIHTVIHHQHFKIGKRGLFYPHWLPVDRSYFYVTSLQFYIILWEYS